MDERKRCQLQPILRFPDFSNSWEKHDLGSVATLLSGQHLGPDEYNEDGDGVPYFTGPSDFTSDSSTFTKWTSKKTKTAQSGSVLITVKGNGVGQLMFLEFPQVAMGRQLMAIHSESFNTRLAYQFLLTKNQYFEALASGNMIPGLARSDILSTKIPVASQEEQQKIADFLTAVDQRVQQLSQKQALLTCWKKGLMQQLFSQTLRFKDDQGNDFPDWEEKKLGEIGAIVGGGTPDSTNPELWKGHVQWFTPTEIRAKYSLGSKRTISAKGLKKCSASILPIGTILFTSRATIAEVSIATQECTTNQGFQSVVVNEQTINEFIYYWIIQNKKAFLRKSQGSTFLEISGKEMRKMPIPMPHKDEQTKIANSLAAIDRKIDAVAEQIKQTQTFKQGLLQQMFV